MNVDKTNVCLSGSVECNSLTLYERTRRCTDAPRRSLSTVVSVPGWLTWSTHRARPWSMCVACDGYTAMGPELLPGWFRFRTYFWREFKNILSEKFARKAGW